MKMTLLEQISVNLQKGEDKEVSELTRRALDQKISALDILNNGLIGGMNVIGAQFKAHEIFLPDVLMAAKAMVAGMDRLKPHLMQGNVPSRGKVVIGTVQGDLHDIGKNLVGVMLKGAGFEVIDLGNDVPPEKFVETAVAHNASVIGMSALLTTTMGVMKKVTEILQKDKLSDRIKVIIGGAPVTREFAEQIGADDYGYDAAQAVESVKSLSGQG